MASQEREGSSPPEGVIQTNPDRIDSHIKLIDNWMDKWDPTDDPGSDTLLSISQEDYLNARLDLVRRIELACISAEADAWKRACKL